MREAPVAALEKTLRLVFNTAALQGRMHMTRHGKIARLPLKVRELNQRLENGEPGVRLIEWLNGFAKGTVKEEPIVAKPE